MRKFFIPMLMASAMLPASAMAQDRDWSNDRRTERSERQREDRAERPREDRAERSRPQVQRSLPAPSSDVARERAFGQRGDLQRSDRAMEVHTQRDEDRGVERRPAVRRAPAPGLDGLVGERNSDDIQRRIESRSSDPTRPRIVSPAPALDRRDRSSDPTRPRIVSPAPALDRLRRPDRDNDRVEHRRDHRWDRDDHRRDWRRDWRYDHRYDWRRHRDRNRWVFQIGNYYDPYRYGYRRFDIGFNLWPSYYSSRYWLNDPWQYRLPPAYGPYRWVRYYDDALLVNIYTGQVVDVIHSFFW